MFLFILSSLLFLSFPLVSILFLFSLSSLFSSPIFSSFLCIFIVPLSFFVFYCYFFLLIVSILAIFPTLCPCHFRLHHIPLHTTFIVLFLPARTSEQGNVIESVRIYIYMCVCVCVYKKVVIEQIWVLIYLKFVATDLFLKIISPSAGENSGDSV